MKNIEAIDAEKCILALILLGNSDAAIDQLRASISLDSFFLESHRQILKTIFLLRDKGKQIDLVTIMQAMMDDGSLANIGGAAYLSDLATGLPPRAGLDGFIEIVKEKSAKRKIAEICSRAASECEQEVSASDLITSVDKDLLSVFGSNGSAWPNLERDIHEELNVFNQEFRGEKDHGFGYGMPQLDRITGGLVLGRTTIFGAPPGQGKTWFILQCQLRLIQQGIACHFFSYELTKGESFRRMWALMSGVQYWKIEHAQKLSKEEHQAVTRAAMELSSLPWIVDDISTLDAEGLCARARTSKRRHDTRVIWIDYLQRMRFTGRIGDRFQQIYEAGKMLAVMAKEEKLAQFWISSLTIKGQEGEIGMKDFRGSGDLPYEAHVVMTLNRELNPNTGQAEPNGIIHVQKSRAGFSGKIPIRFENCRFTERNM